MRITQYFLPSTTAQPVSTAPHSVASKVESVTFRSANFLAPQHYP